jgi:hypothetical protein
MHVFKRLNRFIRFVICVVRLEITDLTEYQDTTIGVVVYRPRALPPPCIVRRTKVARRIPRRSDVGTRRYSSTSILTMLPQVGFRTNIAHRHLPNRPAVIVLQRVASNNFGTLRCSSSTHGTAIIPTGANLEQLRMVLQARVSRVCAPDSNACTIVLAGHWIVHGSETSKGRYTVSTTVLAAVTLGAHSPARAWSNVPAGTKSFALLAYDPDAPTGSGWWHWVAYNIPADATSLPAGAGDPKKNLMPPGVVQGRT